MKLQQKEFETQELFWENIVLILLESCNIDYKIYKILLNENLNKNYQNLNNSVQEFIVIGELFKICNTLSSKLKVNVPINNISNIDFPILFNSLTTSFNKLISIMFKTISKLQSSSSPSSTNQEQINKNLIIKLQFQFINISSIINKLYEFTKTSFELSISEIMHLSEDRKIKIEFDKIKTNFKLETLTIFNEVETPLNLNTYNLISSKLITHLTNFKYILYHENENQKLLSTFEIMLKIIYKIKINFKLIQCSFNNNNGNNTFLNYLSLISIYYSNLKLLIDNDQNKDKSTYSDITAIQETRKSFKTIEDIIIIQQEQ